MPSRPTIRDLAVAAGVGTATVDRVLNRRPGISAAMVERVARAAECIGYLLPPDHPARSRPRLRLAFVLHKQAQPFYRSFAEAIGRAARAHPGAEIDARVSFAPSQAPEDFARAIEAAAAQGEAVAATAVNHPALTRLVEELATRGTPVFALLNDFAGAAGAGYYGLDNLRVGRIAGWMMAQRLQRPARVGVFVGGTRWHGQGLREAGFRAALRAHAPALVPGETAVNLETRQVTYEATMDLLERHADLAGLYVAGGGMEGAIAALREARPPGRVALIVNELTDDSRAALADGYATMAIATPLDDLCRALVDGMVRRVTTGERAVPPVFAPRLWTPESV